MTSPDSKRNSAWALYSISFIRVHSRQYSLAVWRANSGNYQSIWTESNDTRSCRPECQWYFLISSVSMLCWCVCRALSEYLLHVSMLTSWPSWQDRASTSLQLKTSQTSSITCKYTNNELRIHRSSSHKPSVRLSTASVYLSTNIIRILHKLYKSILLIHNLLSSITSAGWAWFKSGFSVIWDQFNSNMMLTGALKDISSVHQHYKFLISL